MLHLKFLVLDSKFNPLPEHQSSSICQILLSILTQTNQAYSWPFICSTSKIIHCFPTPIWSVRGRNYLQKEGREGLAVDLDTWTHASFVGECLTYKRSVNSATLKQFKGPNEPRIWSSPQNMGVLKTAETSIFGAVNMLECRWIYASFVGGIFINKRSVGLGVQISCKVLPPFFLQMISAAYKWNLGF